MLWTLTDGAFEEHLPDRSNTIHQDLQRHCGVANESEFHAVVWDFVLAAMSRRDVGDHVSNERAVTTFSTGVTVVTAPSVCQCGVTAIAAPMYRLRWGDGIRHRSAVATTDTCNNLLSQYGRQKSLTVSFTCMEGLPDISRISLSMCHTDPSDGQRHRRTASGARRVYSTSNVVTQIPSACEPPQRERGCTVADKGDDSTPTSQSGRLEVDWQIIGFAIKVSRPRNATGARLIH